MADEDGEPELRGLLLMVLLLSLVLVALVLVLTKSLTGTLAFAGGIVAITAVLGAMASGAIGLWEVMAVSCPPTAPLLGPQEAGGRSWPGLLLIVPFFAAVAGCVDALARRSPPDA